MNAKAGISPAPRNSSARSVALLRNVIARLVVASEAIEDRDDRLAEAILGDLIDDLLQYVDRLGAASL
jgi:hypothetical protein